MKLERNGFIIELEALKEIVKMDIKERKFKLYASKQGYALPTQLRARFGGTE